MAQNTIQISQNRLDNVNNSRKRSFNPNSWKDNVVKLRRTKGEPYVSRDGAPKPGKLPPSNAKICWDQCSLEGCHLNGNVKADVFRGYHNLANYDAQRTYLSTQIEVINQNGLNSNIYYLTHATRRFEVCRKTFLGTFQITKKVVEYLVNRMQGGEIFIKDLRGTHNNRIRTDQNIETMIIQHINRFPKYETHYSRNKNGDFYLSPDLTVARMFRLFLDENPTLPDIQNKMEQYRRVFRQTKLKIGQPCSDTCKICDELNVRKLSALNNQELLDVEADIQEHQTTAGAAYINLKQDLEKSTSDPNYVVKCGDLQQVLFCPALTHTEVFYKRQLSCYNYCIYNGSTGTGTMAFWDEVTGRRGVDEVASCLLKNIQNSFQRLQQGEERTLIFWSDRCRGQVNNWQMVCLFQYLLHQKYFTTIEQKFLCTGHSYLPCDRLFALIEKRRASAKINIPLDWIEVIKTFTIGEFPMQIMTQADFLDIKSLEDILPRPSDLKSSQVAWIMITAEDPSTILCRTDQNTGVWQKFVCRKPNQRGRIANRSLWTSDAFNQFQLAQKYLVPIPISVEKRNDLMSMLGCLLPQFRQFYRDLPYDLDI